MSNVTFDYRPLEVHHPFHQSTAFERCLFGAFGSGKTYALCAESIAMCLEQPGIRGLVTRFTIPELRDTTETVFFDILPNELFTAGEARRIGGHYESFTFPNGSQVLFRGIDDWNKHKSLNVGFIAYDEADEFDEETYLGMLSRVRQRDPTRAGARLGAAPISRRSIIAAANPAGHNWLWRRFVSERDVQPNTAYFTSTSFDNPYLPAEYIDSLLQYPEPWIRRFVLCQFDDFAGQIYTDWNYDDHVVEPVKDYGTDPVFWMGFDPGTRSKNAGLWVWVDTERKRLVGVAEYAEAGLAATVHAAEWRKIEAKHRMKVRWRVADPTIRIRDRGSNMSLESQYARLGYHFDLGPKSEQDRVPMLGNLITNKQFVVTKECMETYEQIKNYQWTDLTPMQRARGEDAPAKVLKKNVDLVDCAQYVSSRWIKPMKKVIPKATGLNAEIHATIAKQIANRRRVTLNHDLGSVVL